MPVWEGECAAQAHQIYNALTSANQNPFRYIFKDLSFQRDRREGEEEPNQLALYIWFYSRINFGSASRITTQQRGMPVEQAATESGLQALFRKTAFSEHAPSAAVVALRKLSAPPHPAPLEIW